MKYIVTLRGAEQGAIERVGRRAMDLVILHEKTIQIPLCFIITANALADFLRINGIGQEDVKSAPFPNEIEEELLEAYETLAISDELTSANHLMASSESVDVLIIPSPEKGGTRPLRSLKGKQEFLEQVKEAWAEMNAPGALIVEKMVREDLAGIARVGKDDTIFIRAYYGLQGFHEIASHDEFTVSKSLLSIKNTQVTHQDMKTVRGDEGLEEFPLHERGSHQKATDKEVIEMARVAKRTQSYLKRDLEIYFGMKKQRLYLFFCDDQPEEQVAEEARAAEIEISIADVKGVFEEEMGEEQAEEVEDAEEEKKPTMVVADDSFIFNEGVPMQDDAEIEEEAQAVSPVGYVSELAKPFAESQEDDFILTIPGKELVAESSANPSALINFSKNEMERLLVNAKLAIRMVLEEQLKAQSLPATEGLSLSAMASELHERKRLPYYAEILRLDEVLQKGGNFAMEDILFAFDTADRFVREHQ
ncbi:MAG: PEP/pyruvate-binding domain-containing protein [Nanoarchaeota archaeon]